MRGIFQDDKKRKRIAVIGGVFACIFAAVYIVLRPATPTADLPKQVLDLHQFEVIQGDQATVMVNDLHKKEVAPSVNVIGRYQSLNGYATLYRSSYASEAVAVEEFEKMADHIRSSEGGFSHFKEFGWQGVKVYLCLGMGQAHYYFVVKKNLYWFAVDVPIAQASLRELVRLLNG